MGLSFNPLISQCPKLLQPSFTNTCPFITAFGHNSNLSSSTTHSGYWLCCHDDDSFNALPTTLTPLPRQEREKGDGESSGASRGALGATTACVMVGK